jgi:phage/plasmid-like protein (TIGR03299 family)
MHGIMETDKVVHRYASQAPWHGLSKEVTNGNEFDVDKFFEESGLDWNVVKIPLVTLPRAQALINHSVKNNQAIEIKADVDHYAMVRQDTNKILGVVGEKYTPIQNRVSVSWFKDWVETKTLQLEVAGSIFNGGKIWCLASFVDNPTIEVSQNDHVKKYILLSNSHDGTNSLRVGITLIRCVCWNTISLAFRSADSKLIRLRHSSKIEENLNNIKEVVSIAEQDFIASVEQYRMLLKKDVNQADIKKYVRIIIQGEKDADKPWGDIPTRTQNTIKSIIDNMDSPMNPGKPSFWKLYNSINQYLCHTASRTVDARLNNMWWGTNKDLDNKAFKLALELAA